MTLFDMICPKLLDSVGWCQSQDSGCGQVTASACTKNLSSGQALPGTETQTRKLPSSFSSPHKHLGACIELHIYIYIYICMYICIYVCMCVYTYYIYICIHTYTRACALVRTCQCMHVCMYTCKHVRMHVWLTHPTQANEMFMHTYIYTNTDTHILTLPLAQK